jgi:hypothetical protein
MSFIYDLCRSGKKMNRKRSQEANEEVAVKSLSAALNLEYSKPVVYHPLVQYVFFQHNFIKDLLTLLAKNS